MRSAVAMATMLALLAGCTAGSTARRELAPPVIDDAVAAAPAWTTYATAPDQALVDALPRRFAAWRAAVPVRLLRAVRAEGPLLDPAAAEPLPQLSPGSYRCRLIRLGGAAQIRSFAPDFCYVGAGDDRLAFTKQTGTTLPEGYIYAGTATAQVFLGTVRSAGQKGGKAYGADPANDVVGLVTRVAPFRWRLMLARAASGNGIDLYELVPVPPEMRGATGG